MVVEDMSRCIWDGCCGVWFDDCISDVLSAHVKPTKMYQMKESDHQWCYCRYCNIVVTFWAICCEFWWITYVLLLKCNFESFCNDKADEEVLLLTEPRMLSHQDSRPRPCLHKASFSYCSQWEASEITASQKGSGDVTIILFFLFPGLGVNIHCIFVTWWWYHHQHPPRSDVPMSNKKHTHSNLQ